MPFTFHRLKIPDVILIEPPIFKDERGLFMETYRFSEFASFGIKEQFVQDNHSKSGHPVLRGLHYQKNPRAQGKLVRVVRGEIFDVAVDIRKGSPTYGRWVGATLSAENTRMLYVPIGFAHGLCVLSEVAEVLYKVTEEYSPREEGGIAWNDPEIGIRWPVTNPVLSSQDADNPFLKDSDINFVYTATDASAR